MLSKAPAGSPAVAVPLVKDLVAAHGFAWRYLFYFYLTSYANCSDLSDATLYGGIFMWTLICLIIFPFAVLGELLKMTK